MRNLLSALDDDLKTLPWMSEATRKAAAAKVATFAKEIGYPSRWRDYSTIGIVRQPYASNALVAAHFEWRRDLAKVGKPLDRSDWNMNPPEVNAQYRSSRNEIMFPAGILQPPFFYADGDDAINYGAIGGVIGHEITHGFDNSGRKFDAAGNQIDWWTEQDAKNFDERAKCIIQQFDGYVADGDVHEKGELVQGESIADLGGLTIAYRAYRKSLEGKPEPPLIDGLTGDQRFFIANARIWASNHRPEFARLIAQTNEHPLGKFRSIGTISNMPEFGAAFHLRPRLRDGAHAEVPDLVGARGGISSAQHRQKSRASSSSPSPAPGGEDRGEGVAPAFPAAMRSQEPGISPHPNPSPAGRGCFYRSLIHEKPTASRSPHRSISSPRE